MCRCFITREKLSFNLETTQRCKVYWTHLRSLRLRLAEHYSSHCPALRFICLLDLHTHNGDQLIHNCLHAESIRILKTQGSACLDENITSKRDIPGSVSSHFLNEEGFENGVDPMNGTDTRMDLRRTDTSMRISIYSSQSHCQYSIEPPGSINHGVIYYYYFRDVILH